MWYGISLTVGIILLAISIFKLKESLAFLKNCEKAIGIVIELEKLEDSDGVTYSPVFKFKTSRNEEYIYKHNMSSSPASWKIGEQATFAFQPEQPSEARMLTYFSIFNWSIILAAIALPLIVVSGGYYLAQMYLR